MEDIVEQGYVDASFRNIDQAASENRLDIIESLLIRSSLNRFHGKWVNIHRIYTAFWPDQPGRRKRKAAWAAAKVQDCHTGVNTCFLKYLEGRQPVSEAELHRHQVEGEVTLKMRLLHDPEFPVSVGVASSATTRR